jgi:ribosomal protein L40E
MKISLHPRMTEIAIGDEVFSYSQHLFARVEDVFPAAVCVKVAILSVDSNFDIHYSPQLWRADDIENLSVCRYCGARTDLSLESQTGIPFHVCQHCGAVPPEERPRTASLWW